MKKFIFLLTAFLLFTFPVSAHDEGKMTVSIDECVLAKIWFSDETNLEEKIANLRQAVSERKEQILPIHELEDQDKEILDQLLAETSPKEISRLISKHMEIEKTAEIYSRNKLTQFNIILILLINLFVITTIWLAFVSNSRKNKALREKKINDQVLSAQERERRRIAQELHDTVTQDVRTALLYVRELKENEKDSSLIEKIENLETQNLKNLRNIIQNLTSAEIESEDFGELISQHCNSVSENRNISCSYFAPDGTDFTVLTTIQKLNILRIIQEAVNNSLKHAQASSISIIVREDKKLHRFIFFISDDGRGIEASKEERKRKNIPDEMSSHFGLTGMKNRAGMINAELNISSSPEMGTEIKLIVPIIQK